MAKRKEVVAAVALNFFFPGVGYFYAGRPVLGVAALAFLVLFAAMGMFTAIGGLALMAAIDGYLSVKKYNAGIDEAELVKCPNCAERIQAGAKVCRFCQRATG